MVPAAWAHPAFARQLLPLSAAYRSPSARHVVAAAPLSVPQAKGWMAAANPSARQASAAARSEPGDHEGRLRAFRAMTEAWARGRSATASPRRRTGSALSAHPERTRYVICRAGCSAARLRRRAAVSLSSRHAGGASLLWAREPRHYLIPVLIATRPTPRPRKFAARKSTSSCWSYSSCRTAAAPPKRPQLPPCRPEARNLQPHPLQCRRRPRRRAAKKRRR